MAAAGVDALRNPDLAERATGQRSRCHETAMQYGPSASTHANIARLEYLESENRGVQQVSHLMSDKPGPRIRPGRFLFEG
jgi:hypothetical protein